MTCRPRAAGFVLFGSLTADVFDLDSQAELRALLVCHLLDSYKSCGFYALAGCGRIAANGSHQQTSCSEGISMKTALLAFASVLALSSAAFAADPVVEEAVPAPVEVFSWTGGYLGVFGGITAGDRDYTAEFGGRLLGDAPDIDASITNSGGLAGIVAGYDYQLNNNFVIGAYADIAYSSDEAKITLGADGLGDAELSSQLKYLGTVQARVGYAMDRALFYAHGGFAYGKMEYDASIDVDGLGDFSADIDDQSKTGYTVGAGIEYALTDHVSLQTEYSFVDLGEDEVVSGGDAVANFSVDEDVQIHSIKAGINFRF